MGVSLWLSLFFILSCFANFLEGENFSPKPKTASGLERSPLVRLQAVVGGSAFLPCDITPKNEDIPTLVLFFYGEKATPIYSVDGRGGHVFHGFHWSDPDQLGVRANVSVVPPHEGMSLKTLVPEDGGEYRCRVDFMTSPTRNTRVDLYIIVPARHIVVRSRLGGASNPYRGGTADLFPVGRAGTVGPYPEGSEVTLSCQVTGGQPRPIVHWWQGDELVDSHIEEKTKQITRNLLKLPRLKREDLFTKFTCIAQNNNLTESLSKEVTIDIAFPPTSVVIYLKPTTDKAPASPEKEDFKKSRSAITLRANKETILVCEATGSRPQAVLVWRKNQQEIKTSSLSTSPKNSIEILASSSGSTSQSLLKFIPNFNDHKVLLGCEATNKNLPRKSLHDRVLLNILYRPQISINYESEQARVELKEGDEFAFVCEVHANPPAGRIQWAREGIPLVTNSSAEVSIYDKRLVLHKATRDMSGLYTCAAANSEGVNTSQPLGVRIKFVPVCSKVQQLQYGAGINEEIRISCTVESYPEPTQFDWAFNKSSEIVKISKHLIKMTGFSSSLQYFPKSETDFGTILCWARNSIGQMPHPCVIQIVPAAKPDPVRHCEVINNSSMPSSSAIVSCSPGWDGGIKQTFTLEVRESKNKHSRILASVLHSPIPVFHLRNLKPREHYLFIITAANTRGTSPPVTVSYITPNKQLSTLASNAHTSDKTTWISWTSFVAVIFGVMLTILACLCAVIGLMKFKIPPPHYPSLPANMDKLAEAKIVYSGTSRVATLERERFKRDLGTANIISCNKFMYDTTDNTKEISCPDGSYSKRYSDHSLRRARNREVNFRCSGSDVRIHEQNICTDAQCSPSFDDQHCHHQLDQIHNSYNHINSVSVII